MATQVIPGKYSTTIVSDSYAPYGEITVGPTTPREDPRKYEIKQVSSKELCSRYGVTLDELLALTAPAALAMPKASQQKHGFWTWSGRKFRTSYSWYESDVTKWEAKIREIAAKLPKR